MRPRGSRRNDCQLSQQCLECDRKRISKYSVLFSTGNCVRSRGKLLVVVIKNTKGYEGTPYLKGEVRAKNPSLTHNLVNTVKDDFRTPTNGRVGRIFAWTGSFHQSPIQEATTLEVV
ncbi:hypothetical protein J6590_004081 [Homalodisca vitripennis]|nr:hypothetical protein J6590_004081 [Homalodisca vitripennis]